MKSFDRGDRWLYCPPSMTSILIYQDYVHNNGALYKALCRVFEPVQIGFADAEDVKNGALNDRLRAFIMPGGASRYVSDKLNGPGNAAIKEYVTSGGIYIGICAGAYYGCRQIEWRPGFDQSFSVDSELGFFPGTAKGPIPQFISNNNAHHMAAVTDLATDAGHVTKTFYWAGPVFESEEQDQYQVLARYAALSGQPPAIVSGSFGKGRYLLSSSHIEIDSAQLDLMSFDVPDNRYADIAELSNTDGVTTDYFTTLLNRFIG